MKNGIPEPEDGEKLMEIYNKININGTLKEHLSLDEMVLIFCIAKYLGGGK